MIAATTATDYDTHMNRIDRYRGALLGLAVGDAMGAPLMFLSEEQIRIKHGTVTDMIGGGWLDLRPGEPTESVELAFRLARSLVEHGSFERLEVALGYVEVFERSPESLDNITRAALGAIASGTPVEEASKVARDLTGEDGSTNGVCGRCVPIGLMYPEDDGMLISTTLSEAAITHESIDARAGAATVNLFLSRFLRGAGGFDVVFDDVEATLASEGAAVHSILSPIRDADESDLRPNGDVADSLDLALWYLYWGDSFEDAVIRSINRGGPASIVGAVVGALAGAFHGVGAIPERWLHVLEGRSRLESLADDLAAGPRPAAPAKSAGAAAASDSVEAGATGAAEPAAGHDKPEPGAPAGGAAS